MICIKPWTSLYVWGSCSKFCCYTSHTVKNYTHCEPDVQWNGPEMQNARHLMLTKGLETLCPSCPHTNLGTIEAQIEHEKANFPAGNFDGLADLIHAGSLVVPGPAMLSIPSGTMCNSRCKMCWMRCFPAGWRSKLTSILHIKNVISGCNPAHISIGGGDLFACPSDFIAALIDLSSGAQIDVITNGRGLTCDRIVQYITTNRIRRLKISLETTNPAAYRMHEDVPIGDLLTRLRYLRGNNVEWYSSVVTLWTLPYLAELVAFAAETNVKKVVIKPYIGTILENTGHATANIFRGGYTREIRDFADAILLETMNAGMAHGVTVSGLDQVARAFP